MTLKTCHIKAHAIALGAAAFVLSAPMTLSTIDGASAKTNTTMMKKKKTAKAPRATDNKQTPTGGQPGGSAGRN